MIKQRLCYYTLTTSLFVSPSLTKEDPEDGLEIGYHVSSRSRPEVIVEVGRNADLSLPSSSISTVHFSFEVHPESKEIMFHDRSQHHSTQIKPFKFRQDGIFRQVVLQPGTVYTISAGGERKDLYKFELHWVAKKKKETMQEVEQGYRHAEKRAQNPRWARTVDEGLAELSSWYNTRLHTPADGGVQRATEGDPLGKGAWGEVSKGVDLDSGSFIVVKKIALPPRSQRTFKEEDRLRREVRTLSSISHKNIVENLGSNGWGTGTLYIYTGLKAGNVNDLLKKQPDLRTGGPVLRELWKQMLESLDYLAFRNLIHRDVKPDNILYTPTTTGEYHFQLADFGFANQHNLAKTICGTPLYMTPEMYFKKGPQASMMDVWSLFATLISVTGVAGFSEEIHSYQQALKLLRSAANLHKELLPMAREDPKLRASAAQMLES